MIDTIVLTLYHLFLRIQKLGSHQVQTLHKAESQQMQVLLVNTSQGKMRKNLVHLNVVPNGDFPTHSRTDTDTNQEISHCSVTISVIDTVIQPLIDSPIDLRKGNVA